MIKLLAQQTKPRTPSSMLESLVQWFKNFESCVVAYSGGVDSTLLAYAAKVTLGEMAFAVLSLSPTFSKSEHENALLVSKAIAINLIVVSQDDLGTFGYVNNSVNRCYFCRSNLAGAVDQATAGLGVQVRVDGTHVDDMKSPRPGIKALREAGFRAPFVELHFSKEDIRAIARYVLLPNAERASESCLSSRIAFGQRIDSRALQRTEAAEAIVRRLVHEASVVRVRTIGENATVEVDQKSIAKALDRKKEIVKELQSLGYDSVDISKEGYVSGRMLDLFVKSENS